MNLSLRDDTIFGHGRAALLAAVAAWIGLTVSGSAQAQDMSFDLNEAESAPAPEQQAPPPEGEQGGEASGSAQGKASASASGDILSELTAEGDKDETTANDRLPREKEVIEKIYAVQRMYVLRTGRFELSPAYSQTFNDQYVSHPALAAGLNYWITNVLAVGANFLWYQGLETDSDLNFSIRRSARLAVPVTEYQLGAHLNFTYVPIYGKFEMFNDSIFQWDGYLVGGVGVLRTRPVPVIDPAVRTFDFGWRVAFNAGIGLRVFVTRWLTVFGELRDYLYMEKLENLEVALGRAREDESTWIDSNSTLTNNVTVSLGFTMFFPFTFEYSYPK
jgi:outer membrane beta-barrel protein